MQCGRVGSRLLSIESLRFRKISEAFFVYHKDNRTAYSQLKERLAVAYLDSYTDSLYGYTVKHAQTPLLVASKGKEGLHNAFILSGPVYENGVRIEGYSRYTKYIKSGKMLFAYSLTYPDDYKPALQRLFAVVKDWNVLGAYCYPFTQLRIV